MSAEFRTNPKVDAFLDRADAWQEAFAALRRIVLDYGTTLNAYIQEAVEVEKAGLQVDLKETTEFMTREEFQSRLEEDSALKTAFEALTPGRQQGYLISPQPSNPERGHRGLRNVSRGFSTEKG